MNRPKFSFPLSPEALEARNQRAAELLKMDLVQKFMLKYNCPEAVVIENASVFDRWIARRKAVATITLDDVRLDESKGKFLDLRYDDQSGILEEYFKTLPHLKHIREERDYLKHYKIMPLSKSLQDATFETLNIKNESSNYTKLTSLLIQFTKNNVSGYYLYGDLGVGKTYLAACVSNYFAKQNQDVAFLHVPTFLNLIKESFHNDDIRVDMSRLKRVKLLVLDDLGAEPITPWSRDEVLLTILNDRYENKMKTIITSNLTPNQLVNFYKIDARGSEDLVRSRRLVDRILSLTDAYELSGENRRLKDKKGN